MELNLIILLIVVVGAREFRTHIRPAFSRELLNDFFPKIFSFSN